MDRQIFFNGYFFNEEEIDKIIEILSNNFHSLINTMSAIVQTITRKANQVLLSYLNGLWDGR